MHEGLPLASRVRQSVVGGIDLSGLRCGKRDFHPRDKSAETDAKTGLPPSRDRALAANAANSGSIRPPPGNLRNPETAWWGWEDSNLQPDRYGPPDSRSRSAWRS